MICTCVLAFIIFLCHTKELHLVKPMYQLNRLAEILKIKSFRRNPTSIVKPYMETRRRKCSNRMKLLFSNQQIDNTLSSLKGVQIMKPYVCKSIRSSFWNIPVLNKLNNIVIVLLMTFLMLCQAHYPCLQMIRIIISTYCYI